LKAVIVSSIVLIVAVIVIFSPWYSVTTSQIVPQIQGYTTQFQTATTNYQTVTVYTLPSPVGLYPANDGGSCAVSWIYCDGYAFWQENLTLQAGVAYKVTVNQCSNCSLEIGGPMKLVNYPVTSILVVTGANVAKIAGSGEASFIVPTSGTYGLIVGNLERYPEYDKGMLNSISITGGTPQSVELTETLTTYTTTPLTQYSQTIVSPYTILGGVASAVILVLLAVVLGVSILVDRGIIAVSTKHHRKRRKR
jgi:hypothetical protein